MLLCRKLAVQLENIVFLVERLLGIVISTSELSHIFPQSLFYTTKPKDFEVFEKYFILKSYSNKIFDLMTFRQVFQNNYCISFEVGNLKKEI